MAEFRITPRYRVGSGMVADPAATVSIVQPAAIVIQAGGDPRLSADPGNILDPRPDGLFAPLPQLSSTNW